MIDDIFRADLIGNWWGAYMKVLVVALQKDGNIVSTTYEAIEAATDSEIEEEDV